MLGGGLMRPLTIRVPNNEAFRDRTMAFASPSQRSAPPVLALSFPWRGMARTWWIGRASGLALLAAAIVLAIWCLGATAYVVFHDQLLASLIAREADIQYSYEDRIAVLKTQLDRQTSRALVDGQTLATTIQDLATRGRQLEDRATRIDALVRGFGGAAGAAVRTSSRLWPAPAADVPAPSLSPLPSTGLPELRSEASPSADALGLAFNAIETRQARQLADLRGPTMRAVARLEAALEDADVPSRIWRAPAEAGRNVGGPFEPLPDDARGSSFDINVALLRDAVARRERLTEIVRGVPLRRPLEGPLEVTSPFGARLDPFFGRAAMHTGLDLMETYGGPVLATASGTVTIAGAEGGYGNMVEIDHGNGLTTRYAHLSSVEVSPHQKVEAGTIVGLVGSTGRATGPHLHYETRINGEPVDPARFLKAGAALFP